MLLCRALTGVLEFLQRQSQPGVVRRLLDQTNERQAREELSRALGLFQSECAILFHVRVNSLQESRTNMQIQTLNILDITAGRAANDTSGELHKRSLPSAGLLVGRNMEQRTILNQIHTAPASSPARVIILGGGGMGKSTLALSIVNHPSIVEKFGEHRFFASCESAISASGLISDLASHFGISGDQLQKRLLAALRSTKLLIVLDNFETPWEVLSQRAATERFLGELSSLTNVTLLLTMRGCERPLGHHGRYLLWNPSGHSDLKHPARFSALVPI
ncbi:hypothetical protein BKA62DRAFT_65768 [Auriculariales sp. MPI-PUGE-AT-0066]|nr:hypothetical protein BKA62DRAFT_65768 [Auriculariales sp. MPI-PUGE-AT-0066]